MMIIFITDAPTDDLVAAFQVAGYGQNQLRPSAGCCFWWHKIGANIVSKILSSASEWDYLVSKCLQLTSVLIFPLTATLIRQSTSASFWRSPAGGSPGMWLLLAVAIVAVVVGWSRAAPKLSLMKADASAYHTTNRVSGQWYQLLGYSTSKLWGWGLERCFPTCRSMNPTS